jgi:metal-responsive CopG/Arc/MetJ family transcriptional regulator
MSTVKTAISLDEELFHKATRAARKQRLSRSRFMARALEEYFQRQENQELLERINASYSGDTDDGDRAVLESARHRMGKRLKQDRW